MNAIRVLVVDDDDLFRQGLIKVLEQEQDLEVVGEARDGKEAIERVELLCPDVVLMDLNVPGPDRTQTMVYLTQKWPGTKVVVLTTSDEATDLYNALKAGARGYVSKISGPQEIIGAMRQVHEGWLVVSPAMAPRFLSEFKGEAAAFRAATFKPEPPVGETQLTLREQEILRLLAGGMSNSEIADELVVSENTVKSHVKNILGKLHMKNRSQAASYAGRLGLAPPLQDDPARWAA